MTPDELARDLYEERAAIREHDGGQPRDEAERAALAEAVEAAGVAPDALRQRWAGHPDAAAYAAFMRERGPHSYGAAARALGWGATRTWQAEARLRAAGLVEMDNFGRARPVENDAPSE